MIELTIRRPGEAERKMLLQGGVYTLGRQEDAEILLADREVSRTHARLLVDRDVAVVEDLGSGNGTWVGGDRVTRHVLKDGEEIEILPFLVKVKIGARPAPRKVQVLRVAEGRSAGKRYTLEGERVAIGRGQDQDVRLDDKGASRAHAVLQRRNGQWFVRDLESASGVYVNDQRIAEAPVELGDRITVGDTVLVYETELEPAQPQSTEADDLLDEEPTAAEGPSPGRNHPLSTAPRMAAAAPSAPPGWTPAPVSHAPPAAPQGYTQPAPQGYAPPPASQGYAQPPASQGYAQPPAPPASSAAAVPRPAPAAPAAGPGMMPVVALGGIFVVLLAMLGFGGILLWSM